MKNRQDGMSRLKTVLLIAGGLIVILIGLVIWRVNTPVTVQVPPLAIEIKMPFLFNDLSYKVIPNNSVSGQTVTEVGLSTATLAKYGSSCSASDSPIGSLYKITGEYSAIGAKSPRSNYFKFIKQYNGYYMYYTVSNSDKACTSKSGLANTLRKAYIMKLKALNFASSIS